MSENKLSKDQKQALQKVLDWVRLNNSSYLTMGGYAGTGKTTLIAILRRIIKDIKPNFKVAFCSYTGKATRVMKQKLVQSKAVFEKDSVGTIHSLIYSPIVNDNEEIVGWKLEEKIPADLIIVDEASMVDGDIWNDLLTFNIPILAVGDHGQLPPISGNFELMKNPDIKLEHIHRQALENPIIKLSIEARTKGVIKVGEYSKTVKKLSKTDPQSQEFFGELLDNYDESALVLCGYNNTRVRINNWVRNSLGFDEPQPTSGDRVICLRNNHQNGLFNGMLGTIQAIQNKSEIWYEADIEMDGEGEIFSGLVAKEQFGLSGTLNFTKNRRMFKEGDLFDFGYALTVHKAQGSQAKRVVLFEERFRQMDDSMWKRWLYTAVTRAEEELYILGD